jgi:hypothetical protein
MQGSARSSPRGKGPKGVDERRQLLQSARCDPSKHKRPRYDQSKHPQVSASKDKVAKAPSGKGKEGLERKV